VARENGGAARLKGRGGDGEAAMARRSARASDDGDGSMPHCDHEAARRAIETHHGDAGAPPERGKENENESENANAGLRATESEKTSEWRNFADWDEDWDCDGDCGVGCVCDRDVGCAIVDR
jgi:hypothetical protein